MSCVRVLRTTLPPGRYAAVKKFIAFLLAALLLVSLCACGKESTSAFRTLETVGTKHYSVICRGGDRLAPVIHAAVETLAGNGTISALTVQWLGSNHCAMKGDAGAFAALTELPEPRVLNIGVESEFYPIAYEENGEIRGFSADLSRAIGQLLGWEVRITGITPGEVGTQLASGNIDCAVGFDSGLLSASKYDIGSCFMESDILLAVRAESEVRRIRDLSDCRIGTVSDPSVISALRADEKITKYAAGATEYLSLPRCIEALDLGWCSAVVLDSLMLTYYQMQEK